MEEGKEQIAIFDARDGDGEEWVEKAYDGKPPKGGLPVGNAQDNLGLNRHPSLSETAEGSTLRGSNFRVSAGYARAISLCIENSPSVVTLELSNAGLGLTEMHILAAALPNSTVKRLHLDFNPVSTSDEKEAMCSLVSLPVEALTLRGNNLGADGASIIAERLISNATVSSLSLYRNSFGNQGCRAILRSLRYNRSLVHLSLAGNNGSAGLLSDTLETLTRYKMDEEGARQRAQIIQEHLKGHEKEDEKKGKKKKKKKEKSKDSGLDLDKIISGGVPKVKVEGEDDEDGKEDESMIAQVGTVLCGTRILVTLDVSSNPAMGSAGSIRECTEAINQFVGSETAVDDLAAGVLTSLKLGNCRLPESLVQSVASIVKKADFVRKSSEEN